MEKGKHGGTCNRTVCNEKPATWYTLQHRLQKTGKITLSCPVYGINHAYQSSNTGRVD